MVAAKKSGGNAKNGASAAKTKSRKPKTPRHTNVSDLDFIKACKSPEATSVEKIAEMTGLVPASVSQRRTKIRNRLREQFEKMGINDENKLEDMVNNVVPSFTRGRGVGSTVGGSNRLSIEQLMDLANGKSIDEVLTEKPEVEASAETETKPEETSATVSSGLDAKLSDVVGEVKPGDKVEIRVIHANQQTAA